MVRLFIACTGLCFKICAMKKNSGKCRAFFFIGLLLLLFVPLNRLIAGDSIPNAGSNARYIDPTIGNVAPLLEPTRPTASFPIS
jgi:hypothetical protein